MLDKIPTNKITSENGPKRTSGDEEDIGNPIKPTSKLITTTVERLHSKDKSQYTMTAKEALN